MRNCSNDLSCAYVFKSGIDEKHYKCDATSIVKTSRSGSVLYPKGITYVSWTIQLFKWFLSGQKLFYECYFDISLF